MKDIPKKKIFAALTFSASATATTHQPADWREGERIMRDMKDLPKAKCHGAGPLRLRARAVLHARVCVCPLCVC